MVKESNCRVYVTLPKEYIMLYEAFYKAGFCSKLSKEMTKAFEKHLKKLQKDVEKKRNEAVEKEHNTQYANMAALYNIAEKILYKDNKYSLTCPPTLEQYIAGTNIEEDWLND